MDRKTLITRLKVYFDIMELVCPHVYNAFGDRAWQFIDDKLLETLLVVREDILKVGITVNTYHKNGIYDERGLRCNLCEIVMGKTKANTCYLSAHVNGAGIDFTARGMSAEMVRVKIKANENLLPHSIRLERDVTWVHMDIYDYMNGRKINEF